MKVSVIGIGRTGLPMSIALADKGFEVAGIDQNAQRLDQLFDPKWKTREPMCDFENRCKVVFFTNMTAVQDTDISVLMVGTPEGAPGQMDLSQVRRATRDLARALGNKPHTLVISSTLLPGTARDIVRPLLPKTCAVIVNPVWIAQGSVYDDYLRPPVSLLGCDEPMPEIARDFAGTVSGRAPVITDTYTAEMLKLTHNVWCTLKMSFANAFAALFEERGADPKAIAMFFANGGERAGMFLKPGAPFGGPCFPRDLRFTARVDNDSHAKWILKSIENSNEDALMWVRDAIDRLTPMPHTVGVAGLAYKHGSGVLDESASIRVVSQLAEDGKTVLLYDPNVNGAWKGPGEHAKDMASLIQRSDAIIEMHPGLVPASCPKPVIRPWR